VGYPYRDQSHSDIAWLQQKVSEANDGIDDPLFLVTSWHQPYRTARYTPFIESSGGVDLILVAHHQHTEVSRKVSAGRNGTDVWQVQTAMSMMGPFARQEDGYTLMYNNETHRTMLFAEVNNRTLSAQIKDWDGNILYSFEIVK
jgi:hypothetical protein